jgi:hypothetical protein|uniref:S1-like domain-containing protein n=1 Tax=viral metagenome TaxID=1070528 RepID=A0A6C0ECN9_9ZZZZ
MATHKKKHIKNNNVSKELILCSKSDGECYGQINSSIGDARFEVRLIYNNTLITAKARGSLIHGPKKQMLEKNDYILLQKDISSNDCKYYILKKYTKDDVIKLKKSGELVTVNNSVNNNEDLNNPSIQFEGDLLINKLDDEISIDDDFIANI